MSVGKLGFGTMRLPLLDKEDPTSIDLEQYKVMADTFLERGFTYFDTAYPYHRQKSEEAFKEAVAKRHPRESYTIADKMPVFLVKSNEDYERIFNEQLERCGVDHFDYYLLHNLGKDRYPDTEKYGGFEFIAKKKEEGKISHIGFSFHDEASLLDEILSKHPEIEFVQLQINYLDWDSPVTQSGKCYETVVKHGKKVIVMEPVKGGTLATLPDEAMKKFRDFYPDETVSPASLAIRYAASLDNVMMVLSGMSAIDQLEDNTSYMQDFSPLNDEERKLIEEITAIMNSSIKVPCTSCEYCMEVCPMNINIPRYFGLLNLYATTEQKSGLYYNRYAFNHGKASDCLKCGLCEGNCPQHLPIREYLEEFKALYENE